MNAGVLEGVTPFPAIDGDVYAAELEAIRHAKASGVYAIADRRGRVLYVGESHSGRLFDTITRHFRSWSINPRRDAQGRRFGGTQYDRRDVLVAFVITEADTAQAFQFAEIQRLRPRDNVVEGVSRDAIDLGNLPV